MNRFIYTSLLAVWMLAACSKNHQDNTIPEGVPDLNELQMGYTQLLVQEQEGWYVEYRPTSAATVISILVKFFEDGTATIVSDYQGYTSDQEDVRFRVGGLLKPELIFETFSVFHAIAENIGGRFEFYISPNEDNSFTLTQVNGPVSTAYTLRKAGSNDKDNILAKANTALLLQEFATNASAYFKNLNLPGLAAFWELDTDRQTLRASWEEGAGEVVTQEFTYNYIANGILLNTPLVHGSISIDRFIFGELDENELEIIEAGNAGAGSISVSHVPAFPYRGTANLFMRIENELPRFFAYTLDNLNEHYSIDLQPYVTALHNVIGTDLMRIQLYHYNMNAAGTTPESQLYSMQLLTRNGTDPNVFLVYYTTLTKVDESHVIVAPLGTTNVAGTPYLNDVLELMDIIFPPEGVTIVPNGRSGSLQKLRVISRKNSRIYFDVIVSTPTGIYVD